MSGRLPRLFGECITGGVIDRLLYRNLGTMMNVEVTVMARKTIEHPRKHEVKAALRNVELVRAKSSLKLSVYAQGQKIGELQIGRGSLYWWGHKRKLSKRISWSKFAAMMDRLAYEGD